MTRMVLIFVFLFALHLSAGTAEAWTTDYDAFLKTYVVRATQGRAVVTQFDYTKARNAKATESLRLALAAVSDINSLGNDERLAFWLNAYNFLAIDVAIRNPGIKKLTDLNRLFKSVWKQTAGTVASKEMSLDDIEHGLIRKQFSEPRIHVALVCAAKSCPNLREEAYTGSRLDRQLDEQLRMFTDNTQKGLRVDIKRKRIYLSAIFKWFDEDFPGGPVPWLVKKKVIKSDYKGYSVKYLDYDWTLNNIN